MPLGDVYGHSILDRDENRSGRVEDVLLECRPAGGGAIEIVVTHFASGPLAGPMPRWLDALARLGYRLLGLRDPRPAVVPWSEIDYVDVAVHLCVSRAEAGIDQVERAVERWLRRVPRA